MYHSCSTTSSQRITPFVPLPSVYYSCRTPPHHVALPLAPLSSSCEMLSGSPAPPCVRTAPPLLCWSAAPLSAPDPGGRRRGAQPPALHLSLPAQHLPGPARLHGNTPHPLWVYRETSRRIEIHVSLCPPRFIHMHIHICSERRP